MFLIFLILGMAFLALDRSWNKGKVLAFKERLDFFIRYYEPFPSRRNFFGMLLLIAGLALISDYLLYKHLSYYNYLVIFSGLFLGPYVLILFLAIIDSLLISKVSFKSNYLMLERGMLQQFSLALMHPIFFLAYLIRNISVILLYPRNGILFFNSFSGLIGFLSLLIGAALYII